MLERNVMSTTKSLETLSPATATTAPDKLNRSLSVWNSLTIGFAVVSPVVGLYAIIGVQTAVTGGGWFSALAICLVMQLLVATVYAELTSQFPIAGGGLQVGATTRRGRHRTIRRSHLRQFHDCHADHHRLYRGCLACHFFWLGGWRRGHVSDVGRSVFIDLHGA